MSGKPIRLGKAASELNVGLPTLLEFLSSKGIKIDSNPNSKLDPEHFQLLCTEFAADQNLK
jgi:translation initiation factor IF-2